jgi:hypothetical protein
MDELAAYQQVNGDLDSFGRMTDALEAYADLLSGQGDKADGHTLRSIRVGLESIDPDFDIKEGSAITLRALKDGIVKVAKATKAALKVLFEMIGSLYVKFTGSLGRVRGHQRSISKRLGKMGNKVTYTKMEVSGINRLCVDGKFVGAETSNLEDIRALSEYVLEKYPKAVADVARDAAREFVNLLSNNGDRTTSAVTEGAMAGFAKSLERHMKVPHGTVQAPAGQLPSGVKDNGHWYHSAVLPGNYALLFIHPGHVADLGKEVGTERYGQLIQQSFAVKFTELQMNTADRSARTIDVPSIKTLSALVEKISAILEIGESGEAGMKDFQTVKSVVDDAIRTIADRSERIGQEANNSGNALMHMLGAISQKLAEPMGNFTHWLAVELNVYLTFIGHCLNHYEAEGV